MAYNPTIIIFIILVVCASSGCGRTNSGEESSYSELSNHSEDTLITANLKGKLLRDSEVKGRMIQVETTDGTVHLNGVVNNNFEAQRAEKLAREIPGVVFVRNNLRVRLSR